MLDLAEFARLVKAMREAQTAYCRGRQQSALQISKDYERRVDRSIADILSPPTPALFDPK